MIYLLSLLIVILIVFSIFREIAYSICRKDKEKLRAAIQGLIGKHVGSGSEIEKSLLKLLKETYP